MLCSVFVMMIMLFAVVEIRRYAMMECCLLSTGWQSKKRHTVVNAGRDSNKLLGKCWRSGGRCSGVFSEGDLRWLVLFGQCILQKIGELAWDRLRMNGRSDGEVTGARSGARSDV
jgi:hypothetical protein